MNAMHHPNDLDLGDVEDDYEIHQRSRDEDYRQAYAEWISSLPAEELEQLADLCLDRPCVPRSGTESPRRGCRRILNGLLRPTGAIRSAFLRIRGQDGETTKEAISGDSERFHDLLRRLVGELIDLSYCGNSMTEIAKRHEVTRSAVSKRCVELSRTRSRCRSSSASRPSWEPICNATGRRGRFQPKVCCVTEMGS